jgi:Outer membrane receptor for ferrienterochelin and colicins
MIRYRPFVIDNPLFPGFIDIHRCPRHIDIPLSGRQKIVDQLTLKTTFFYHNHEDDYVSYDDQTYSTSLGISTYKDYLAGGNLFADYKPVEWNILRAALHFKVDSHKERDDTYLPFAESLSRTGSIAIENEFNLIENLSIVAGLSYDKFRVVKAKYNDVDKKSGNLISQNDAAGSDTKDAYNPMIGAVYTFADSTKLFGSVAKKTRFPTLHQLYSGKSGNPDLDAEQSINYTIGTSRTFFDICRAELSFFHHDISDWISRDGPVCLGNTYQNWAEIKMYGFEFNSDIYPMEDLILKLGYTYNYARDKSDGRVTDNVSDVPEHKIDAQIQYTIPSLKTKLNFNGIYIWQKRIRNCQRHQSLRLKNARGMTTGFLVRESHSLL